MFSFITKYRWDPKGITDEETAWLGMHFTETQIIKLLALTNLFDGFHKMIVSLDLYDFCSIGGRR
jgi:alkylhydroperoxidase family enzyme